MKTRLGGRTWAALLTFGLFGQIAWVIENMYFNVFLYNTISGDTSMIAAMVAWSAVTATVTTLVMGALSDRLGRRKALIVIGYLLWGVSIGAFAFIKRSPLAGAAHGAAVLVVVLDCVMTFFGSTANDAAFNAWVTDVTVPENRGRVETVLAIMPLVAMLRIPRRIRISPPVLDRSRERRDPGNWRLFFLIVGGITCLGGVLGCFFIREPDLPRGQGSYFANILYGFRPAVIRGNPRLYLSLAALGVYCMSQQVYMPYLIIYIQRFLGITDYTLLLAGADRQLRVVGAGRAAHRPLREAPLSGPGGDPGLCGPCAHVLCPGPVVRPGGGHRDAGRRHGGLRLLQRSDPGLYPGGKGRPVPGHPHRIPGAAAHGHGAVYRRGGDPGHRHDL